MYHTLDQVSVMAATTATLNTHTVLSDTDTSNSDTDTDTTTISSFESSILSPYLQISSSSATSSPDLIKIRSFLSSSSVSSCLICLDRIQPSDPTWSCLSGCHVIFHLPCIQSWAHQASSHPKSPNLTWHCPKCRVVYPHSEIPRAYFCFCGKLRDPPADAWLLPHTCGDRCERALSCGDHRCLLLCHPGPCPPCPALVPARCFCGRVKESRRCARREFSCNTPCSKPLERCQHRCPNTCHAGPCPPCNVKADYRCACGKTTRYVNCSERGFRCEEKCDGVLKCGKHGCERGCHSGECGECPNQGRRTCPCGKKEYRGVACDADVATCGSTCEKVLACGRHRCPERCHRGVCVETCRAVVVKSCRCGGLKKEVPCYQDLVCERKCQHVRDCGRHACRRRCCDGDCPPCPEICGKKLRCNNHKCPSPCHRGTCAPCPLMVTIQCACGETHYEVPCGIEKSQKPPKCHKPCNIPRLCRHKSECRPHRCHYGACPPCRLICGEELSCGHSCKQRCHGPIPPPKPEFTLKPKKKKTEKRVECTPGSVCPPCEEVIYIPCRGQHMGEERPMICSKKMWFCCQNLCGNLLPCSNHYCTKTCHVLRSEFDQHASGEKVQGQLHPLLPKHGGSTLTESCEECRLPCQKVRELACPHPCPLPCHSGDCPTCKVLIKRSCHCGTMKHVFECTYYNTLSDKERENVRSCGGPCHRKLPNCPHLCSIICHPGECLSDTQCMKKVTVRCICHNLKKEWLCKAVLVAYHNAGRDPKEITKNQFGVGLLPCNDDCASKVKVVESDLQLRKSNVNKNKAIDPAPVPKRRKRRERIQEVGQPSKFQEIMTATWKCIMIVLIILMIFVCMYYGYYGILWLSDWMNKIEDDRQRRRYQRP